MLRSPRPVAERPSSRRWRECVCVAKLSPRLRAITADHSPTTPHQWDRAILGWTTVNLPGRQTRRHEASRRSTTCSHGAMRVAKSVGASASYTFRAERVAGNFRRAETYDDERAAAPIVDACGGRRLHGAARRAPATSTARRHTNSAEGRWAYEARGAPQMTGPPSVPGASSA
jgi:hypothetical protein